MHKSNHVTSGQQQRAKDGGLDMKQRGSGSGDGSDKVSDKGNSQPVLAHSGCDAYQSSIANHLSASGQCADSYRDDCFSVLSRGRSRRHLEVLESMYIHTMQPVLCKQKQNVAPLHLFKSHLCANPSSPPTFRPTS